MFPFDFHEVKTSLKFLTTDLLQELLDAICSELSLRSQVDAPRKVKILIPQKALGDSRKGEVTPHAKLVTGVDRSNGDERGILGEFLPISREIELPEGAIVAVTIADGSWRHPHSTLYILRVIEGAKGYILDCEIPNTETVKYFSVPQYYTRALDLLETLLR